jgi:hypothetical protein
VEPKKIIAKKLRQLKSAPDWYSTSFPKQSDFIKDPAKLKAAHCTRRAGKSFGAGLYLVKEAFENPGVSVLYIALTRDSAERIMWKDVLKNINRRFRLGAHFNEQKLVMTLPNGSVIYLMGADARTDEMDKFLGQKYKLVVIDEASKYRINLHKMIFDVLKPAVADYEGTIALIGTASNFVDSYFAKLTMHQTEGWSIHKWSAIDNQHMKRQFQAEIDQHIARDPECVNEAWFIQNYMGEWVVDNRALIYRYTTKNLLSTLPIIPYTYCLGIVVDHSTEITAFAITAYSSQSRDAYVVETRKVDSIDLYKTLETTQILHRDYKFSSITYVDQSKKLLSEIRARFSIPIDSAPEKDKTALIKVFAAELNQRNIKVFEENADLLREWNSIIKDEKFTQGFREDPRCHNALATATLYAWYKCYNYNYEQTETSEDPMDTYWDKKSAQLTEIRSDEEVIDEMFGR